MPDGKTFEARAGLFPRELMLSCEGCSAQRRSHHPPERNLPTSVARVTEITAASKKSFEDAVSIGIDRANKTLKNVKGAWIQEQKVEVEGGKIVEYRVNMKVTFVLTA